MSRIAKKPIQIPTGVDVNIEGQLVKVKGPKGELAHSVHQLVSLELADGEAEAGKIIKFTARQNSKFAKALWGTSRALVNNMVIGVHQGFEKKLELVGVGYRAQLQGKTLNLTLGLSHPSKYDLPEVVTAELPNNTTIIIRGSDKQKVGQVAAELRSMRPPEPYKGKGIRYADERIVLKETKKK